MTSSTARIQKIATRPDVAKNNFDDCSEEEKAQLLNDLRALRADRIKAFAGQNDLAKSGTKDELVQRINLALASGAIRLPLFISFLDSETIWGKQHITLFGPPVANNKDTNIRKWSQEEWVRDHLSEHRLASLLNRRRPLILPTRLQLCSIEHSRNLLRVLAIQRREGWERIEDFDEGRTDDEGAQIQLRAFKRFVTRGLMCFEWDLITNVAMLQISQLPTHHRYEDAQASFSDLVSTWLQIDLFSTVRLSKAISSLYASTKQASRKVRAHGVEFEGLDGRRLTGRSKLARQSLEGNPIIDSALDSMHRSNGLGQQGNFFFIFQEQGEEDDASESVHAILLAGNKNRINFPTPQDETKVRHVLRCIREAC